MERILLAAPDKNQLARGAMWFGSPSPHDFGGAGGAWVRAFADGVAGGGLIRRSYQAASRARVISLASLWFTSVR